MTTPRAVGIDLGSTNSVAAFINASGHSEISRDHEGNWLIPSLVLFDDERVIVGEEARLRGRARPDRLVADAKRDLGQPTHHQVIGGEQFPPEVMQACLLRHLTGELAAQAVGEPAVVIAVPGGFTDVQRRATAEAAEIAGLRLVDLIGENVAAALAFGEDTRLFFPQSVPKFGLHIVVLNLGGCTSEATLIHIDQRGFTILGNEIDNQLGGHDWNLRLAEHLAREFKRQTGIDPRKKHSGVELLLNSTAQAQRTLQLRAAATLTLQHDSKQVEVVVDRAKFHGLAADLFERSGDLLSAVVAKAGIPWSQVAHVLLVGGASQLPGIRDVARRRSGKEPDSRVNPEEAIARGAALFAAYRLSERTPSQIDASLAVANIATHSLSLAVAEPPNEKCESTVLIPRGTPLPVSITRDFVANVSARGSIELTVLEGESPNPAECSIIGRAILRELPPDFSNSWPIEVTFQLSSNGGLNIEARLRYTDRSVHLKIIRTGGVSKTLRDRWKTVVAAGSGFAAFQAVVAYERGDRGPAPVVIAVSPPLVPVEPDGPLTSILKRCKPFLFRKLHLGGGGDDGATQAATDRKVSE